MEDISEAELCLIPESTRRKIELLFSKVNDFGELIVSKTILEQDFSLIKEQCNNLTRHQEMLEAERADGKEKIKILEKANDELKTNLIQEQHARVVAQSELAKIQSSVSEKTIELENQKKVTESFSKRVTDLEIQIQCAKERETDLNLDMFTLTNRVNEVESLECSIKNREERLNQERHLMIEENKWLQSELKKRDTIIRDLRKQLVEGENKAELEKLDLSLKLRQTNDDAVRNLKLAEERKIVLNELSERLSKIDVCMVAERNDYESQIKTHQELSDHYKISAQKAEKQCLELSEALKERQEKVDMLIQQNDEIVKSSEATKASYIAEMSSKSEEVEELRQELQRANELLSSKNRVLLSDEEIAQLSPGAAAMSKMLKSNKTLTEIYYEYVHQREELESVKQENAQLNAERTEMVSQWEEYLPALTKYRIEAEEARQQVANLRRQLQRSVDDMREKRIDLEWANKEAKRSKNELDRQKDLAGELQRQNRHLLITVERLQPSTNNTFSQSPQMSTSRSSFLMTNKTPDNKSFCNASFFTAAGSPNIQEEADTDFYSNVEELQEQNFILRQQLRELRDTQEERIEAVKNECIIDLQTRLENSELKLTQFNKVKERMETIISELTEDRDRWKLVYEEVYAAQQSADEHRKILASSDSTVKAAPADWAEQFCGMQTQLARNVDEHRELTSNIDSLSKDLHVKENLIVKLQNDLAFQEARVKTLISNYDILKDKNLSLDKEKALAEFRAADLGKRKDEISSKLLELTELKASAEVGLRHAQNKISLLENQCQALEERLQREKRDRDTNDRLNAELSKLQKQLSTSDRLKEIEQETKIKKLEEQIIILQKELSISKEKFWTMINDDKNALKSMVVERDNIKIEMEHCNAQLKRKEELEMKLQTQVSTLTKELDQIRNYSNIDPASSNNSNKAQISSRLRITEDRLVDMTKQLATTKLHLDRATRELSHTTNQSSKIESKLRDRLSAQQQAENLLRKELQSTKTELAVKSQELNCVKDDSLMLKQSCDTIQNKILSMEKEKNIKIAELNKIISEGTVVKESLDNKINILEEQLKAAVNSRQQTNEELKTTRTSLSHMSSQNQQHKRDIEALKTQLQEALNNVKCAEMNYLTEKQRFDEQVAAMKSETDKVKQDLAQKIRDHEDLTEDISKITAKMSIYEQRCLQGEIAAVVATTKTGEDDETDTTKPSFGKLHEVVKHLRDDAAEYRKRAASAEEDAQKLRAYQAKMQVTLEQKQDEIDNLKKLQETFDATELERKRLIVEIGALKNKEELLSQAQKFLMQKDEELQQLSLTIDSQQDHIKQLEIKLSHAEKSVIDARTAHTNANIDLANVKTKLQQIISEKTAVDEKELMSLRVKVTELTAAVESEAADNKASAERIDTLTKQTEQLPALRELGRKYRETLKSAFAFMVANNIDLSSFALQPSDSTGQMKKLLDDAQQHASNSGGRPHAKPLEQASVAPMIQTDEMFTDLTQKLEMTQKMLDSTTAQLCEAKDEINLLKQLVADKEKEVSAFKEKLNANQAEFEAKILLLETSIQEKKDQLVEIRKRAAILEKFRETNAKLREELDKCKAQLIEQQQIAGAKTSATTSKTASVAPISAGIKAKPQRLVTQNVQPVRPQQSSATATAPVKPQIVLRRPGGRSTQMASTVTTSPMHQTGTVVASVNPRTSTATNQEHSQTTITPSTSTVLPAAPVQPVQAIQQLMQPYSETNILDDEFIAAPDQSESSAENQEEQQEANASILAGNQRKRSALEIGPVSTPVDDGDALLDTDNENQPDDPDESGANSAKRARSNNQPPDQIEQQDDVMPQDQLPGNENLPAFENFESVEIPGDADFDQQEDHSSPDGIEMIIDHQNYPIDDEHDDFDEETQSAPPQFDNNTDHFDHQQPIADDSFGGANDNPTSTGADDEPLPLEPEASTSHAAMQSGQLSHIDQGGTPPDTSLSTHDETIFEEHAAESNEHESDDDNEHSDDAESDAEGHDNESHKSDSPDDLATLHAQALASKKPHPNIALGEGGTTDATEKKSVVMRPTRRKQIVWNDSTPSTSRGRGGTLLKPTTSSLSKIRTPKLYQKRRTGGTRGGKK